MNYLGIPQSPAIHLKGITAELNGQSFTGTGMSIVVGRQPGCQIQINNNNISRQHARITNANGQWMVEDLNSSNGTYVNGQRITGSYPIRPGDRLGLGKYEFLFNTDTPMGQTAIDVPNYQAQPVIPSNPPPQPYYPAPQPVYTPPPPAPKKKNRTCLVILLILAALCCVSSIIAAILFGSQIVDEVLNLMGDTNIMISEVNTNMDAGQTDPGLSGVGSLQVTTNEGGVVSVADGASLIIPPGAVPPQENGEPGQMVFSMVQNTDRTPTFNNDYTGIGSVYEMGPEGFIFTHPVTLVLPIPSGVDVSTVLGATYYDDLTESWTTVPASIDEENHVATVSTTHFSLWSLYASTSTMPQYDTGTLRVVNDHRYNSGSYPPAGGNKPYGVTYGICIDSYSLDDPDAAQNWSPPTDWLITVSDYRPSFTLDTWDPRIKDFRFPTGSYTLTEVWHFSEVNMNPLSLPEYSNWYRPYGTIYIEKGKVSRFAYTQSDIDFSTMTEGRPVCFGLEDTSVGTGDIQVTLTWDASVDLDLWVEDPTGETVYWANNPIPSGGELDRDNACGNFISGRPENIFWPTGNAPSGTYTVFVNYFSDCDSTGSVAYTVRTVVRGQVSTYQGTITYGNDTQTVTTFTIP
jgi:hypothetical protein